LDVFILILWCLGTKDVFPDAKCFVQTKQSIISTVVQRTLEVQLLEFDRVCQKGSDQSMQRHPKDTK
jgi:hypothetical protein